MKRALREAIPAVCSVPLFLEYEAVLLRPEQLLAAGTTEQEALNSLNAFAGAIIPVEIQFLWRPQLRDPNDDIVLELAVKALGLGSEVCILTFNRKYFLPKIEMFTLQIKTPQQFFEGV